MHISVLGILRHILEEPLNSATSRDSTAHAVVVILVEVEFFPTTHAVTMTSIHNSDRALNSEYYEKYYV